MVIYTEKSVLWWEPETLRPWIGNVFIASAEIHLLILAAFLVIQAIIRWALSIQKTFEWLRKPIRRINSQKNDFNAKYLSYLKDYQKQLLSKKFSIITSLSIILIVLIFISFLWPNPIELYQIIVSNLWAIALLIILLVWGFFIGLIFWPAYVTLRFIQRLSNNFEIVIQPSHPDKCGGYKPLGDFCFSMSLPVIIGGLACSFVGIVGLGLSISNAGANLYMYFGICQNYSTCYFDPFFSYLSLAILVFICTPMIFITFFLPLWNIHRFMVASKRVAEDEFATRIAELEKQIRYYLDKDEGIDNAIIAKDKLEIVQAIDPNKTGYPVWPFRGFLLLSLFSPQILSIGGFALSFYEVFIKAE
jgi:hypothetical protein